MTDPLPTVDRSRLRAQLEQMIAEMRAALVAMQQVYVCTAIDCDQCKDEVGKMPNRLERWREALAALLVVEQPGEQHEEQPSADIQLLAWAVVNSHMLARRALARTTSVYDREKWEHVLRICEKAGARSPGVLRATGEL